MKLTLLAAGLLLAISTASTAEARTICTLIADAGGDGTVLQEGDCDGRVTPASTFKVALSLMGYDSGYLKDEHEPTLAFRKGYVDWGGDNWKQPTDAVRWMKHSVVWFSQQMTKSLGEKTLHDYATKFDYGNADFSGDPGRNNGLERAWIASSLKISPREQVAFLKKLVNRRLPVSAHATAMTLKVVEEREIPGGWTVHGKTGAAFPRRADGSFDEARGWGWFVGWAEKDGRTFVFARLIQDERKEPGTPGVRARDAFLGELPALLAGR
ncbi:Beta-lactamase OXA-18 [Ensifer sp. M14]|uniref:class D beta-lactamase n=1 Tax=Ensifer sp. M14 TaxID=2203782 RepID=UPI000E1CD6AC|nr:class D beta-lactamase [Ensifer sp. M14]RDL51127.1 Beta-lactamase OXA-18 [Ensifer sp. M14]